MSVIRGCPLYLHGATILTFPLGFNVQIVAPNVIMVSEEIGSFEVCLNITQPPPGESLPLAFSITVNSMDGSAGM